MQQTAAKHVSKPMKQTGVCESVSHAKVTYTHVFFTVSPIGCRTVEINTNISNNISKSLQHSLQIHVESMSEKIVQETLNMTPKWRSNSIKNICKNDTKNVTDNNAKMKRPKAICPKGR